MFDFTLVIIIVIIYYYYFSCKKFQQKHPFFVLVQTKIVTMCNSHAKHRIFVIHDYSKSRFFEALYRSEGTSNYRVSTVVVYYDKTQL